jgi:hypothetical protein
LSNLKYADRIISDVGFASTHVLKVAQNRLSDFFSVDCTWFWNSLPNQIVDGTHVSENNQVISLVGADPANPPSLGGEITLWVDDKKHLISTSSLIFVPAGVPFGPVQVNHMEHPINYAIIGMRPDPRAVRDPSIKPAILSQTKEKAFNPPIPTKRTSRITNILHSEDDMVKGSFYVNVNWQYEGYGQAPVETHDHEWPELIAMMGCDPNHPYDLGGTYCIDLDGETYYLTKSCLVCIPAHVKHCPWRFLEMHKPTLTITTSPSGLYYSSKQERW